MGGGGTVGLVPKRDANGFVRRDGGVSGELITDDWRAAATVPGRGGSGGLDGAVGRGGRGICDTADEDAATVKFG